LALSGLMGGGMELYRWATPIFGIFCPFRADMILLHKKKKENQWESFSPELTEGTEIAAFILNFDFIILHAFSFILSNFSFFSPSLCEIFFLQHHKKKTCLIQRMQTGLL